MKKALRIFVFGVAMTVMSSGVAFAAAFRVGDEGDEVARIQSSLASLGYDVAVDGAFGSATSQAVKDFQKAANLNVDGIVGAETYEALMHSPMPEISRGTNLIARRIIADAMRYIGVPYVFGGTSPSGFDCSGYVQYVFAQSGISLPRMADSQFECGEEVKKSDLIPGDLVFFSTYEPGASHVGIYIGEGHFIDSTDGGVQIESLSSPYRLSCYYGARRVI